LGLQYYDRTNTTATSTGSTFPIRALETVSAGSIKNASETLVENKTVGAFFQQQVEWKNRVFLTGAVRGDDNSAFGANYNFVAYPKLSASWVISEEPFFARVPVINSLKLRSAWGRAGQQPDAFAAARTYQPTVGPGGVSTLSPQNLGNPDLCP
jgi:outer membrane receptor protein involved in Fe transport